MNILIVFVLHLVAAKTGHFAFALAFPFGLGFGIVDAAEDAGTLVDIAKFIPQVQTYCGSSVE